MLNYLKEKRENLFTERTNLVNQNGEELISEKLNEYENKIRNEFAFEKDEALAKIDIKIEVIDELIKEQEDSINCAEEELSEIQVETGGV